MNDLQPTLIQTQAAMIGTEELPEEKKTQKRVLADSKQIEEIRKNRKLRLADLIAVGDKVATTAPSPTPTTIYHAPPGLGQPGSLWMLLQHNFLTHPSPPSVTYNWPYELILVRHGQSEGNEAVARSEKGDLSAYTPEFRNKHSSTYRLTDKGIWQAKVLYLWLLLLL